MVWITGWVQVLNWCECHTKMYRFRLRNADVKIYHRTTVVRKQISHRILDPPNTSNIATLCPYKAHKHTCSKLTYNKYLYILDIQMKKRRKNRHATQTPWYGAFDTQVTFSCKSGAYLVFNPSTSAEPSANMILMPFCRWTYK